MIICAYPKAQYDAHSEEIQVAIQNVLDKGIFIFGDEVSAFQKEFASYVGLEHGFGVANGTDAIVLALRALDIGPGDEVITVSHTAVATVAAIEMAGATPCLVDVEDTYFTIDPEKVREQITEKTKAVIAVHIFGQSAHLDALSEICKEANIALIEDCAQAHGALWSGEITQGRLGSIGDVATYSFYPTKNLGAIGDGGFVACKDAATAEKIDVLRQYGWRERYISDIPGVNSRLDELQAAILRVKLKYLDEDNNKRRAIAKKYKDAFKDLPLKLPQERKSARHIFHIFAVELDQRDALQKHLLEEGVHTLVHYPMPIHLQPAYAKRIRISSMEVTERISNHFLSLPMYPELDESQVNHIISSVKKFF